MAEKKDSFQRLLVGKDRCGERKVRENVGPGKIWWDVRSRVWRLLVGCEKSWCGRFVLVSGGDGD